MKRESSKLIWQELRWPRPFQPADVVELLSHLAVLSPRKQIVWEARGSGGKVRYFIATGRRYMKPLKAMFLAHGQIEFSEAAESDRPEVNFAKQLKITKSILSLKTDNTLSVLKTALAALADTATDETLTVQIVLGESITPSPAPDKATDPHATLLDAVCGKVGAASRESLASIKGKAAQRGFYSVIRIGASANTRNRSDYLLLGLQSAFRQLETAGVRLIFNETDCETLNEAKIPWFLTLKLSIAELAGFVLLPCSDAVLAGIDGLHPKLLRPPAWLNMLNNTTERAFAKTLDTAPKTLSIPIKDSLEHTIVLGPTGSGKSTLMLNLIMADIQAGRGVLVIDPKADLVNDILARVPEARTDDVVVVDPSDACPVGINPFTFNNQAAPSLISDTILSVFQQIYKDSWGVYSQDVLSAALLTLAQTQNATLLQLSTLLTNESFRKSVVGQIKDKQGLEPFWAGFEAMSPAEQRRNTAPVLNKLRQFTLRPALRNVLGQAKPKFTLSDLFEKNKIVLVPLNKGLIGAEAAKLLGSLIVGLTWTLALSRANTPAEKRRPVSVFIDELQDYLALPTDFADALAQARGLGVGFTVAHQYRSQLTPAIKAAIDANARNKIVFNLSSTDAKEVEAMSPELETADFMALPRHHIYANLQHNGKSTGWISGQTLPAPSALRLPVELKAASAERYGQEPINAESAIPTQLTPDRPAPPFPSPIGRKKIN
ncbi:conjugal transfer protein TraG [Clostridia bacterium]|nr:conjugal transfer protein TraG [Clostridia bacterium]